MKRFKLDAISSHQNKVAWEFAEKCVRTNADEYRKRNQNDLNKVTMDIYHGKVAEFSVYNEYRSRGIEITEPDVQIYPAHYKSFDSDLQFNGYQLHVKSCMISKWEPSWVFQPWDTLTSSPGTRDLLALAAINEDGSGAVIYTHANWHVVDYQPARKKELNKKVLYYNYLASKYIIHKDD